MEVKKKPNSDVSQIRMHVGIEFESQVKTSIDALKQNCIMKLTPAGVEATGVKQTIVVPYANIHQIFMARHDH